MTEMRAAGGGGLPLPAGEARSEGAASPPDAAASASLIRRVYRNALLLYLVALLVSLGMVSARISLGLTAGTALGVGIIASWQWAVARAFAPAKRSRMGPGVLMLLKLPIVGAAIYFLLTRDLVSPGAFAVGFLIPQASIALLALGQRMVAPGTGAAGGAAA